MTISINFICVYYRLIWYAIPLIFLFNFFFFLFISFPMERRRSLKEPTATVSQPTIQAV
jgi:hypothetical protein